VTSDYNLFYNSDPLQKFISWRGASYFQSQWATFKSKTGQDTHSPPPSDPLFVSSSDYHLRTGSQAIHTGVNMGLKTDYDGNSFKDPPSIGAYEYDSKPTSPVIPIYQSSYIENATPSVVEMIYNLSLANIVPETSAFLVIVNEVTRIVNSATISGTKVLLTLATPVVYGDNVTVSYTKPATNSLQSTSGGQTVTISAQMVSNRVNAVSAPPIIVTPPAVMNTPPVAVVNYSLSSYSGFVNEIDASGSFDPDKDNLTFTWSIPGNLSVSATNCSKIQFLSPIIGESKTVEFTLNISDGKNIQSRILPVEILPYKPELKVAEISSIEASSFQSPYYPYNILDGNIGTMWSANGDNQWLIMELKELFNIQLVKIGFQPEQKRESYFDILGSDDKLTWEPILTKSSSCDFSGDLQVFNFPPSKTEKEFRYIKLVGHSNSGDSWNYFSEFKIFGFIHRNPSRYEKQPVKIYPNPAHEFINIRIDESTLLPDFIRIISLSGKVVFQDKMNPNIKELQIPLNLIEGVYFVQIGSDNLTVFTQKLIVGK